MNDDHGHVPSAPTRPGAGRPVAEGDAAAAPAHAMTLAELFGDGAEADTVEGLDEKLRQAYFWMVNHAIISPHYDVEFTDPTRPGLDLPIGDSGLRVTLPSDQSYSSFVLLPLLTFAVRGRCLLVGGPGRGKTSSALLMGLLAGYSLQEVRRAVQHGHPQLTVQDMFGTPLPRDLVAAESLAEIDVAWRTWLGMRVKIVDEYNRIPTRTQSALLTVLADSYVEVFDQLYETPPAAWYLTANDDAGGGTYQVVDALRDRIDVVVRALSFNPRFLGDLVERLETGRHPEAAVPESVIFSHAEHDALHRAVLAVPLPRPVRRRLEYFASQLEVLPEAGWQVEYRTKDTARLAAVDVHDLLASGGARDPYADIGMQTLTGLSVRALQSLVVYAKAMAFFRGNAEVSVEDVAAVLPFVLHDKLQPDLDAVAFEEEGRAALRTDRVSWIRDLFATACREYERESLDDIDPVGEILATLDRGLDGVPAEEVRRRLSRIEGILRAWAHATKPHGHVVDDALALKYAHQRYSSYLRWLEVR
ncbi:AAA family ATPase [Miniimonas arenae]|nr:AAA family ATPase [Miniimonas arenae]